MYKLYFFLKVFIYRVDQQCCPGGNRPGTPRGPPRGGSPDFWAKSLVIPAVLDIDKLDFCIYGWNYQ